jgi:hypothetical protein
LDRPSCGVFALRTFTVHKCTDESKTASQNSKMESIGSQIPVVEVTAPDGSKSLWAAAVAPENAVAVVAMLVPAGHIATLSKVRLTLHRRSDELRPGEVRRVRL